MIIRFENVSYSYAGAAAFKADASQKPRESVSKHHWGNDPDQVWALREVTFTLDDGEFLGIAGHTGSGKSTLLWTLAGLLKPLAGSVIIDDGAGSVRKPSDERGAIGLVFQYPEHQLFAPTVLEDVCFGPRNLGLSDEEARERALSALQRVGLDPDDVASRSPFQLSGGQQRRVALAGVLAMEPSVLALDEPAAGLDPRGRQELLELVKSLHDDGIGCVMISHSMETLAELSDRILVMNAGRVFALDSPERVFHDVDRLKAIGLDVPAAQALAHRLRSKGFPLPDRLYDESSLLDALTDLLDAARTQAPVDPLSDCHE